MTWGGKRIGSGRPKRGATKPIRVPINKLGDIAEFLDNDGYKLPYFTSKISAGPPSFANDDIDGYFTLNSMLIRNFKTTSFFTITGDSLKNIGILDGDTALVDSSIEPKNGMIVKALVDNSSTVKRLKIDKTGVFLLPENDDYQPIKIGKFTDFKIQGVVTSIVRRTL